MLLSNKVTGSTRGQYRLEAQSTEMNKDFVESKGSTNLGYSNAISRFWIRSSVDFKILHAKFHILGRKAQPVGITFSCLDKNVPFDGPFRQISSDAPRDMYSPVLGMLLYICWHTPVLCIPVLSTDTSIELYAGIFRVCGFPATDPIRMQ